MKIKNFFNNKVFPIINKLTRSESSFMHGFKMTIIVLLVIGFLSRTYSWLYEEYVGNGVSINFGKISHAVTHYDEVGNLIQDDGQTMTLLYEKNLSNVTRGTKFIKIENDGTLDLEYTLSLSYEGTVSNVGVLYYRMYEVTEEVKNYSSLEEYALANPVPDNVETDSTKPVKNMSLINNELYEGEVLLDPNGVSAVYYRIDYGMYQTVNTALYSGESMSLHFNVYSTQIGATDDDLIGGQIWQVSSEEQLREILISATNGDTIQLMDDFEVAGTVNIGKRINLDTNDHKLTITGDLVYDFANMGELLIDVTGTGELIVENNFYLNTPKAEVDIIGGNKPYDMIVGGESVFNGIQEGEKDGLYLENLNMVNSATTMVPADITVRSNTRLTIAPNVTLGTVYAEEGSTNIEVINNGNIVQLNFSQMDLLKTFTKAQIYVYNLGNIYGIVGSTSIVLPETSTPYLGPNNGNTWIVKGITSNDITISGSDNFNSGDIEDNMDDVYVVPIEGEDNSYIVYIKDSVSSVESLLVDYFTQEGFTNPYEQICEIRKLVIYTLNAQYFENEDFDFLKGDLVPYLKHLDLSNSRIIDGETPNKIKNQAMQGKSSLKEVILSSTVTEIGDYAFSEVTLGNIPNNSSEAFYFLTIPSSLEKIGNYAFDSSEFVYFEANNPPTFSENTFNYDNSKIFVNGGAIDSYLALSQIREDKLYQKGDLSDDRKYIVFEYNDGLGISYVINNIISTSTIGIPSSIMYKGSNKNIYVIGINAYRHMDIYLETGASVSLPSSVIKIDKSAFRELNITSVGLGNVVNVNDYAFYKTNIDMLQGNKMETIGNHAFESTKIKELSLSSIREIGDYAFSNVETMYSAYLYNVSSIGDYAFYNCKYLNKVYFTNKEVLMVNNGEEIDINIGTDAVFSNWGFYTDGRLRVYVPDGELDSGKTFLSLYQKKFAGNENYIFVTGHEIGSYTHYALPYDINVYTVREVDIDGVNGWEIVSYQGEDLGNDYVIPEELTFEGVTKNVISIGDYAYRNVLFQENNTIKISNNSLVRLGNYALSNMDITSIKADNIKEIGSHALYGTKLQTAEFMNLSYLGDYALAELLTLNMVNLGTVKEVGYSALYNAANLEQIFINNNNYDIVLGNNAIYNVGVNASKRFRMYVPGGETSLNYYKTLFIDYADYIYETGIIVGSYINAPIMYDIGEYSVKEVELEDRDGNLVSGYELIEYHGANLSNIFNLPERVNTISQNVAVNVQKTGAYGSNGAYTQSYKIDLINKTDQDIVDWKLKIDMTGVTEIDIYNSMRTNYESYVTVSPSADWDKLSANGTKTIQLQVTSSDQNFNLVASYFVDNDLGEPLIRIGDRAFINIDSNTDISLKFNNSNLLEIGDYAFYDINGIKEINFSKLTTIGDYAFYNNSLNKVETPNLKSIGTYAFSNMPNLYYMNLGKVLEMSERSLYNLPNLLQVFFTPSDETVLFNQNAIDNVGGNTNDRIRFYVDKKISNVEIEKSETVNLSAITYSSSRTQSGNGNNRRYTYTITATVTNPHNRQINSWMVTMNLGSNGSLQTTGMSGVSQSTSGSTVTFTSDGNTSTIAPLSSVTFTFVVRTTNNQAWTPSFGEPTGVSVYTELFQTNNEYVELYRNSFKEEYRNYFYTKGEIIGMFTPTNIPFEIGEYSVDYITYEDVSGSVHYGFEIIEWHGKDVTSEFELPSTLTADGVTLPVISIGEYAFRWAQMADTEYLDINTAGLLRIDDYAFYNINVKTLNTPNVDYIGQYAFYNNLLYTVNLNSLRTLGDFAFANNVALNMINLGNVSVIGNSAFEGCTGLEQMFFNGIDVDSSAVVMKMTIGANAFNNIATTIGKRFRIYVPDGAISSSSTYKDAYKNTLPGDLSNYIYENGILVGNYTYSVLPYDIAEFSVKAVTVNGTSGYKIIEYHGPDITSDWDFPYEVIVDDVSYPIISIGAGSFVGVEVATNDTWNLVIPNTIMMIEDRAFYQVPISSISSNASIDTIGVEAFAEISQLTNVNLGTVKYISEKAFYLDTSLTTVRLGPGVEYIGSQAFYNTYNDNSLSRVYLATETPPTIESDTWPAGRTILFWTTYSTNFYVPRQSVTDYRNATNWSTRSNYINASSELYNNTWYYELDETNNQVTIVEYIGTANNVTIPDTFTIDNITYNVVGIKAGAFDASTATSVTLSRYISYIEEGFLNSNTSVTNIYVNANNTLFSSVDGILYDYNGQTLIRYPNGRTDNDYTIMNGTKVLANGAFAYSTSLTSLTFNDDLIAIGTNVFNGATALRTLTFTSVVPPYLMGFGSFPTNYNLVINYPSSSGDAYSNNLFYDSYRNYLRAN